MFFLWLILILLIIIVLFFTSTIKLEVKNFARNLPKIKGKIIDTNLEIRLKLYLLNKIKIFDANIADTKIEKKFETKLKEDKNKINLEILKNLKEVNVEFEKIDLKIWIGLEDAAATAISVGILWTVLGILFRNKIKRPDKQKYEINPIYQGKNILNIEFNGIFILNMWNIINIIFKLIKKGRVKKDGRTSNRRAYAYSNE